MLLIGPKDAQLVLVQDTPEDRELLAMVEDLFDWQAGSLQLFGSARGSMVVGGQKIPINSFRSVLGVKATEQLEYKAYGLVDELLASLPPSLNKDCLGTSYHEVATNWFRLMLAYKVLGVQKNAVAILELDYYAAFEEARKQLGRKHIQHVDADWKERQKSLWQRRGLLFGDVCRWFSPTIQRHTSQLGERLEPIRYRAMSKLVHWGGTLRNKTYAVRYHTMSRFVHWAGVLRILVSKIYRFSRKGIGRVPILSVLLVARPRSFARRTKQRSIHYLHRSREIYSNRFGQKGLFRTGLRYLAFFLLSPFKLLMVLYGAATAFFANLPSIGRKVVRFPFRVGLWSVRLWRRIQARVAALFAGPEVEGVVHFPELANTLSSIADEDVVLMTVSDSGTGVNLNPGLIVCEELGRRNITSLIMTDSPFVVASSEERGGNKPVFTLTDMSELLKDCSPRLRKKQSKQSEQSKQLRRLKRQDRIILTALDELLQIYWPYHMRRIRHINNLLAQIERSKNVRAIFSVNDYLPVAVAVGSWGLKRDLPWIGHFPILVGARPDGYFFPAPEQLPYGGQLRDHLISAGTDPEKITVVGAHTYDQHSGRDRNADRLAVEKDFPRAKGQKLVTIGTEAFPDPETELGPILSSVPNIAGVHVVLKLHPEDSLDFFEEFADKYGVRERIDIVKAYPLGQLLGASDLLMVVISNIAIEAAVIGTPTLMCDFSGKADVINFVEEGLCVGCADPDLVGKTVQDLLFDQACGINAKQKMQQGIERFNGPNDGKSCERIARYIAQRSGLEGNAKKLVAITSSSLNKSVEKPPSMTKPQKNMRPRPCSPLASS